MSYATKNVSYATKKAAKEREAYVLNLFNGVCRLACMRRHWFTNEVFIDAMNLRYKPSPEVKKEELERIIKKHPEYDAISSSQNKLGLYSQKKKMANLHVKDGKRCMYRFFWCCNKDEHPSCMDSWSSEIDEMSFVCRRVREAKITVSPSTETVSNKAVDRTSLVPIPMNPWDSTEYENFYGKSECESGLDVTIHAMLDQLEKGLSSNFVGLVEKFENEDDIQYMTVHAQNRMRLKCVYLTVALEKALEGFYAKKVTLWSECCQAAVDTLKDVPLGLPAIVRHRTVMDWFLHYKRNGRKFIVPTVLMKDETKIPLIFSVYPDFKQACIEFIDNNIGDISVSIVHRFMNKCLKAIMSHDTIFINDDSDSDDEGECVQRSDEEKLTASLSDQFNEIANEMSTSKKEKRKKNLILKGLAKCDATNADFSLDATRGQDQITSKEEFATEPQDMTLRDGERKKLTAGMNFSDGINQSTAYRWMCALGYTYCEQRKSYYSDAHERLDVVRYRVKFVHRYLNEYEPYMMRWVQIPLLDLRKIYGHDKVCVDVSDIVDDNAEKKDLEIYDILLGRGLTYMNDSKEEMIEFHVDTIIDEMFKELQVYVEKLYLKHNGLGANPSVFRKDKSRKILICLGQDECIFKQYLLHRKAWQSKSGRFRIRPKDDGSGVMVSAFQSREFGFGFPDFEKVKNKVNRYRKGKTYIDKDAAMVVYHTDMKRSLNLDPFIQLFEYGNAEGREGYWSYDHMILQLEDVLDVLYVAFGDKYDFVPLFDHSCGHDRMRPDALNVNCMNVGYGGKSASRMHSSLIREVDGYLGNFFYPDRISEQLSVGMVQSFVYTENDIGPFYMSEKERNSRKYDVNLGSKKPKSKTKVELKREMINKQPGCNIKGNAEQIRDRARLMGLTLDKVENKVLEGWVGKPKGMKQIAFERGFIDLENIKLYTKDGPKDEDGKTIDESFSLKKIISGLTDFVEEETLLQVMSKRIGTSRGMSVTVDRSPKGHPEVAGEGIEYTWANSKIYLRSVPLDNRRTKAQFLDAVRLSISRDSGAQLSRPKISKFSGRARDFIAAYYLLHNQNKTDLSVKPTVATLAKKDIEKTRKKYRGHRGVEKQDTAWCVGVSKVGRKGN